MARAVVLDFATSGKGYGVRIETDDDVAKGFEQLREIEPKFRQISGPLPLRRRSDGFGALMNAIVGQQVSTASAAAIWGRLQAEGFDREDGVFRGSDEDLKRCGLSGPKVRYARALAAARLDYNALRDAPVEEVLKTLIAVPGIGRWTAEIYAKFALGHADVFAAGDLALQEGAKLLFDLPERPGEKELRAMAEAWSPVRAIAARALWAYYREKTKREGAI